MTIKDYALELNLNSQTIIKKLKSLGFNYNNENEELDDEAIILLDNEAGGTSSKKEETVINEELESKYQLEDRATEVAQAYNIDVDNS